MSEHVDNLRRIDGKSKSFRIKVCIGNSTIYWNQRAFCSNCLGKPHGGMESFGLDYYIGHGIFVGWVEHPDIFCWVSFLNPTYVPAIFYCQRNPTKWPKIEPNHSIIPLVREAN